MLSKQEENVAGGQTSICDGISNNGVRCPKSNEVLKQSGGATQNTMFGFCLGLLHMQSYALCVMQQLS